MEALQLLFGTDIGLLSVLTVVFATGLVVYLYDYAKKHMKIDGAAVVSRNSPHRILQR